MGKTIRYYDKIFDNQLKKHFKNEKLYLCRHYHHPKDRNKKLDDRKRTLKYDFLLDANNELFKKYLLKNLFLKNTRKFN